MILFIKILIAFLIGVIIASIINYGINFIMDSYYRKKQIKRWKNATRIEREEYKEEYGYYPPGWYC